MRVESQFSVSSALAFGSFPRSNASFLNFSNTTSRSAISFFSSPILAFCVTFQSTVLPSSLAFSSSLRYTPSSSNKAFRASWAGLREALLDRTAALADLAAFHDAFAAAYAGLLAEVGRREMLEAKMTRGWWAPTAVGATGRSRVGGPWRPIRCWRVGAHVLDGGAVAQWFMRGTAGVIESLQI